MHNMEGQNSKIDELIKYLFRVFNGVELTQESMAEKKKFGEYINDDENSKKPRFFHYAQRARSNHRRMVYRFYK